MIKVKKELRVCRRCHKEWSELFIYVCWKSWRFLGN